MSQSNKNDLTREELYDRLWSTPTTKVAAELGISDVALRKRCLRLNVPKPPLGYWAKVAAGQKPKKVPLPPTASELFIEVAKKPVPKALSLPNTTEDLHPLALELTRALTAGKPDYQKRIHLNERTLPEVIVSKAQVERVSKLFHVILSDIEPLGIPFRKAQSSYGPGYFQKGQDRLYFKIEEDLIEQPTRRPNWQWRNDNRVPSGLLTFSLNPDRYGMKETKQWKEDEKLSLEEFLSQVVSEIRRYYVAAHKRRAEEAIEQEKQRVESELRWQKYQKEEAIRVEVERKRKHTEELEVTKQMRINDLMKAAEWWRLHRVAADFINDCEHRWRTNQQDNLTAEQEAWLAWARENAKAASPFETGYPDPQQDGPFDPASVQFESPYPMKRDFPYPPTMPKIPPAVVQQSGYSASQTQNEKPYPFWLKNQRR